MVEYPELDDKQKLLRMIIRCNKVKKHKPRKVKEHVLTFEGLEGPLFPESEIQNKSKGRSETRWVRQALQSMVP